MLSMIFENLRWLIRIHLGDVICEVNCFRFYANRKFCNEYFKYACMYSNELFLIHSLIQRVTKYMFIFTWGKNNLNNIIIYRVNHISHLCWSTINCNAIYSRGSCNHFLISVNIRISNVEIFRMTYISTVASMHK